MAVEPGPFEEMRSEIAERGFALRTGLVGAELVASLVATTDRALEMEGTDFPHGDPQHGRLLFAPEHGGAFLDVLELDAVFGPMEAIIAPDLILYTMTTSVLQPGSSGSVGSYHADFDPARPPGLSIAALVMLDQFEPESGPTEFLVGSHRTATAVDPADCDVESVHGAAGDVVFFDPMVRHRSSVNHTTAPRRALLIGLVRPWLRQRVDVTTFMASVPGVETLSATARRRLGITTAPPRSRAEFLERRPSA